MVCCGRAKQPRARSRLEPGGRRSGDIAATVPAAAGAAAACMPRQPESAPRGECRDGESARHAATAAAPAMAAPQAPSQLDQALLKRLEHRLAAGVDLQLPVDALDVAGHGLA